MTLSAAVSSAYVTMSKSRTNCSLWSGSSSTNEDNMQDVWYDGFRYWI